MIDVKELRIGSHFHIGGLRRRVIGINGNTGRLVGRMRDKEGKVCDDVYRAEYIEPIPITEELLRELGFVYHEYDNAKLWEMGYPDGYKSHYFLEREEDCTYRWNLHLWDAKETEVNTFVSGLHELENWVFLVYERELIKD